MGALDFAAEVRALWLSEKHMKFRHARCLTPLPEDQRAGSFSQARRAQRGLTQGARW
jgi:hypothetical protein